MDWVDSGIVREVQAREHHEIVARVNAEGWKTARTGSSPVVKAIAKALMALAVRLDATVATRKAVQTRACGQTNATVP
jgi:hypothetical protein